MYLDPSVADLPGLLQVVFTSSDDAITVYDARGVAILRNPAARRMFPAMPPGLATEQWHAYFSVRHLDGSVLQPHEVPVTRALRGETVTDQDLVVRTTEHPDGRIMRVQVHPLPAVAADQWSGCVVMTARDVTAEANAAAEIAQARDVYASILEGAGEQAIIRCDPDGTITLFNTGAQKLSGYDATEMLGRRLQDLHDPDELAEVARARGLDPDEVLLHDALSGWPVTLRWSWVRRDGSRLHAMVTVSALADADGRWSGVLAVATDVTEQVVIEQQLADSERRFRLAFDTAPVAMMIVGLAGPSQGRILQVNTTMTQFTGLAVPELLDEDVHELTHPDDRAECAAFLAAFVAGETDQSRTEKRYLHADGTVRWGLLSATLFAGSGTADPYLLCLIEDTTARRQAEAELRHLALHDALTGLPNRALLRDRLTAALRRVAPASLAVQGQVGVLYCDLDGFKQVNDTAGHAAGDELLQEVAQLFDACLGPADTLARLGGDEFAVVCPGIEGTEGLAAVAEALIATLRPGVTISSGTFTVGVSIGAATALHGTNPDALLDWADTAMYAAKRAGKNRVELVVQPDGPRALVPGGSRP